MYVYVDSSAHGKLMNNQIDDFFSSKRVKGEYLD